MESRPVGGPLANEIPRKAILHLQRQLGDGRTFADPEAVGLDCVIKKQMVTGAVTIKWERMSGNRVRAFQGTYLKNKKKSECSSGLM